MPGKTPHSGEDHWIADSTSPPSRHCYNECRACQDKHGEINRSADQTAASGTRIAASTCIREPVALSGGGSRSGPRRLPELSGIREAGTGTHSSSGHRNLTISGPSDSETSERCSEKSGSGPSTLLRLPQIGADIDIRRVSADRAAAFTVATPARFIATASVCRTRCRSARCPSTSYGLGCASRSASERRT